MNHTNPIMKTLYEGILDTEFNGPSNISIKLEYMLNKAYKRKQDKNAWFAYFNRAEMARLIDMVRQSGTLLDKTSVSKFTEPITDFDAYCVISNKSRVMLVYRSTKDRNNRHDIRFEPDEGKSAILRRYDESWSFSKDYKHCKGEVYSLPTDVCLMLQRFEETSKNY